VGVGVVDACDVIPLTGDRSEQRLWIYEEIVRHSEGELVTISAQLQEESGLAAGGIFTYEGLIAVGII
jgi:hypothetical protein